MSVKETLKKQKGSCLKYTEDQSEIVPNLHIGTECPTPQGCVVGSNGKYQILWAPPHYTGTTS